MKKVLLSILVGLLVVTGFCFSGCKKKNNLDKISANLTNYTLDVVLDVDNKTATAKQEVDYINSGEVVLKNVCFHLYPQFFKEGATNYIVPPTKMNSAYPYGLSYAQFNIQRGVVDGQDCAIKYLGDYDSILDVPLNDSLLPNARVKIEIEFSFTLPNCRHRFGYGDNTINIANFYPIACVYDKEGFNVAPYHSNGDPFYSSMANYEVNLKLDKNYVVAGSGNLISKTEEGNYSNYKYSAKVIRDFALVVSNKFKVISAKAGDVNVEYYYFDDNYADTSLKAGVDAINTFSKKFGNYPYKNFALVKADFIQGGMEFPNLVMISADITSLDDYLYVIVHETAHQWWYGVVGNDEYSYPWLDEALVEYCSVLFYDYNKDYNLTHQKMVEINRENYSLFITVYEDVLGEIDTSMRAVNEYETEPEYTYCVYVKGVLMYESLYTLIGEKAFIKALGNYYKAYAYTNVTPECLFKVFEETSGMNLQGFFDSWISGKVVIK